MATTLTQPNGGNGFQFRMTVSLGNIIQLATLLAFGIIGYTTVVDRQQAQDAINAENKRVTIELTQREEVTAQLNARQAAIMDDLERRVDRVEKEMDERK
jgi:hypothetical protein